jgi:Mce-associated membrane protein
VSDHERTDVSGDVEGDEVEGDDVKVDVNEVEDEVTAVGDHPVEDLTNEDSSEDWPDGDGAGESEAEDADDAHDSRRRDRWMRVLAYALLPGLALILALGAGYLKYVDNSIRSSDAARVESMQAAEDGTIAILSYTPDKVEQQLGDAGKLLTGEFQKSYASLTHDVVIPGAKQKQISAAAAVAAAASVSADPRHAVVLVFVDQTTTVGADKPSDSASSVRVTLDKVDGKWLMSGFDPV